MTQEKDSPGAARDALTDRAFVAAINLARDIVANEARSRLPLRQDPGQMHERLGLTLDGEGCEFEELVERLRAVLMATPSSASRLFVNQLFGGRVPVATMAEMLTALTNSSMYTYKAAGPQILIEEEVLGRMLDKVGYFGGEGAFCPGGSLCNLNAMLLARNAVVPNARETGLDGRRLVVYASDQCHYSLRKAAGVLGIGRERLRLVPSDARGRMRVDLLEAALDEDRDAGRSGMMIVATAGTTVLGAFDPIREIADLARERGIWLHVDGAFGASVLLSERHRCLVDGCELADSIAWDPHKMLGMPLSCSVLLLRKSGQLDASLNEQARYLFQADDDRFNPGTRSIQCGRRNDALKLWVAWAFYGDRGLGARIDRQFDLARCFAELVEADGRLRLVHTPECVNICFERPGAASAEICDRLDREGRLKIGFGQVDGRDAIRMVCVNPDLTRADLVRVIEEILAVS